MKGYKSCSAFTNFYFNSYRDDFYILILARPLKVGPIRFNVLKRGTSKPGLYRPKDRQRSEVLKKINIEDNGFKDLSSWESTKRGPYMSEDRPCKLI